MRIPNYLILLLALFNAGASWSAGRLQYVATASQKGPVGYRDPAGVISPDGDWLAYSEGRHLKVQHVFAGPVKEFEPLHRDIRYIAWLPDSQSVAIPDRGNASEPMHWYVFDIETGTREPLWPGVSEISGIDAVSGKQHSVLPAALQYLTWSADGQRVSGIVRTADGTALWVIDADGRDARVQFFRARLSYPAYHPEHDQLACLSYALGTQRLNLRCADSTTAWPGDQQVYGPAVFSPAGDTLYYASPNERGTLDLWSRKISGDGATRLTGFDTDTYAPSIDEHGRVLFKVQDYRAVIAMAPASGGPARTLTMFQSDTPSWDWSGHQIGFTYGDWRRVTDDFRYPDIAQDVGFINLGSSIPAGAPHGIVSASSSEDQGQHWSPNGKWIAFHSHFDRSDDIWLVPADHSREPRQLTAGGYEVGWPRWSPDGKWIVYTGQKGAQAPSRIYVLGIDQDSGEITEAEKEVPVQRFSGEIVHAEWAPDSNTLLFEAAPEPGKKVIYRIDRDGGRPHRIHAFDCEEKYSGIGVSPKGNWIAYVAPGPRGYQQVYRIPMDGGDARLVTTDPTNKTHPAYSPDGEHIAFTVWRYEAQFWLLNP